MDTLLSVEPEVYEKVPKIFERNEKSLQDDVNIIKQWMVTQPHLPELMGDHYIRNFLILNKCSIEKTKKKIDMYYTIRSIIPEIYDKSNPKLKDFRQMQNAFDWLILPKLTQDMYRVAILRVRNAALLQKLDSNIQLCYIYNIYEIRLSEDYMYGDIVIVDFAGVTFSTMAKWTPAYMTRNFFIYEKVYSSRVKGIYMVNCPSFIGTLLAIMKNVLKPKLFARIKTFPTLEGLTKFVEPRVLPPEYGGEGTSVDEIKAFALIRGVVYDTNVITFTGFLFVAALWRQKFDHYQDRFDTLDKIRVDENLRPEKLENNELLGFYGNFKQLNVD